MSWEMVASTGEWAGAIAVVATLFYLARQVKQQNDIARFNAWTVVTDGFTQLNAMFAENDEITRLFTEARNDLSELSDLDAFKYQQFMMLYFNHMNKAFRAHCSGFLSADEWHDMAKQFYVDTSSVGGQAFRQSAQTMYPDFWEEVDRHQIDVNSGLDHELQGSRGSSV